MNEYEHGNQAADSLWRWWPCFIGGFCGPLLAHFLVTWVPPHVAVGTAFFIMWFIVGLLFAALPPAPSFSLVRWTSGGALGAIVAGTLAFVTHWK